MLMWVQRNRGAFTEIAKEVSPQVSPQFVHLVFRGMRRNSRVENLLRKRGAPIPDPQAVQELEPTPV